MAALYFLDFKPDILHCHDWQAAMTPVYLRALYHDWCPQTKLVFTIHNVEYQLGRCVVLRQYSRPAG